MSWRAPMMYVARTTMTTAGSLWTLQRPPRWQGPAPSTKTSPRWVLTDALFYKKSNGTNCFLGEADLIPPLVHCLSLHVALKGPRSHDSRPVREEPATKSGPNIVAKKCQWISGLPNKVNQRALILPSCSLCKFLNRITCFIFNRLLVLQNWRHRGAAWLLTRLNK